MPLVDKHTCTSIQCGATTQLEAGMQQIMDCSSEGYNGVRSCLDPLCINDLRPSYCSSPQGEDRMIAIPFSPANNEHALTLDELHSSVHLDRNPMLGYETKHSRDNYQELVMCPGGETSEYMMGLDSWRSINSIFNKLHVLTDLGIMEWLGFLTPVALIGGMGYLMKKR